MTSEKDAGRPRVDPTTLDGIYDDLWTVLTDVQRLEQRVQTLLAKLRAFPPEQTCACEHPYIGTQKVGDPIRCEQCRLLIPLGRESGQ